MVSENGGVVDDVILYVASDGAMWTENETISMCSLEGPPPRHRVIAVQDGTGRPRPLMVYMVPNMRTQA